MKSAKRTVILLCVVGTLGLGLLRHPAFAAPGPKEKADPKRTRELQEERLKVLEEQWRDLHERVPLGKVPLFPFLVCAQELCEARLELAESPDQRLRAVEKLLASLREIEEHLTQLQAAGLLTRQEVAQARAARLKAEIRFAKLKAGE